MQEEKKELKEEENKPKRGLNGRIFIGIITAVILIAFFIILSFLMGMPSGSQDMGLEGYTQEELDKMYPQVKNADIPTRTTPEETYAKLKEALKNEDVDKAAEQFAEKVREEWRNNFKKAKQDGFIKQLAADLPDIILKVYERQASAQYSAPQIVDGQKTSHTFNFIKDGNGDWKIESI